MGCGGDSSGQPAVRGRIRGQAGTAISPSPPPNRYFAVVFFDSHESAMENSSLPETKAAAEEYMKVSDGPPTFYDLDILDDRI